LIELHIATIFGRRFFYNKNHGARNFEKEIGTYSLAMEMEAIDLAECSSIRKLILPKSVFLPYWHCIFRQKSDMIDLETV